MQIVIKISKNDYEKIKDGHVPFKMLEVLQNGVTLPEGHGDLIDVNRKITVSTYNEQYEEWGEKTLTVLEALNRWSDEGVTLKDVIIPAYKEGEE